MLSNWLSITYKNFRKLLFFGEFKGVEKLSKAKDEAFISLRLKYRVSEENKETIYISELLDKVKNEYNLCFKIFRNWEVWLFLF